jgi:hypothetical protein
MVLVSRREWRGVVAVAGWVIGDRVDDDASAGEVGETHPWMLDEPGVPVAATAGGVRGE